jgi:predicted TIM-barrel fold metal-dependent hydrolase
MPTSQWLAIKERTSSEPGFAQRAGALLAMDPGSKLRQLEARVKEMDEAGVDVALLSAPPPGVTIGPDEHASGRAAVINDELIESAAAHDGRFYALPSLPLPDVERSLTELDRLIGHPIVRGIMIYADNDQFTIDEDRFEPVYARIAQAGLPCVLHPSLDPLPPAWNAFRLAAVGQVLSSTLSGLRLIYSGMLDRVPDLQLLIPHLGGVIPYLGQRIEDLVDGRAEHSLLHYLRTRTYTDSCSYFPPALRLAAETFGADRIMLASDYPFRGPLEACVRDIQQGGFSNEQTDSIMGGTAQRLFSLPVPTRAPR